MHTLKLNVSKQNHQADVLKTKKKTLREWFLSKLFGDERRVMILVPGDTVESIEIHEKEERTDGTGKELINA